MDANISALELREFKELCRKDRKEGLTSKEQERYDHIVAKAMRHITEQGVVA